MKATKTIGVLAAAAVLAGGMTACSGGDNAAEKKAQGAKLCHDITVAMQALRYKDGVHPANGYPHPGTEKWTMKPAPTFDGAHDYLNVTPWLKLAPSTPKAIGLCELAPIDGTSKALIFPKSAWQGLDGQINAAHEAHPYTGPDANHYVLRLSLEMMANQTPRIAAQDPSVATTDVDLLFTYKQYAVLYRDPVQNGNTYAPNAADDSPDQDDVDGHN